MNSIGKFGIRSFSTSGRILSNVGKNLLNYMKELIIQLNQFHMNFVNHLLKGIKLIN